MQMLLVALLWLGIGTGMELVGSGDELPMKEIMTILGISDAEDLDEEVLEKFEQLQEHPLALNLARQSELEASGLLSQYQIVSLLDYRSTSGDILSMAELSLLDGFGEQTAEALRPFVSLVSHSAPGLPFREELPVSHSFVLRSQVKSSLWTNGVKYRYLKGLNKGVGISVRKAGADPLSYSFYGSLEGRNGGFSLIVGDFKACFGQGLSLWTGYSMSGVSAIGSFYKRPTGISPSWSYSSSSLRGVVGSMAFGRVSMVTFVAFPGLRAWMEEDGTEFSSSVMPGLNLTWRGHSGQVGITAWCQSEENVVGHGKISSDARFCLRGIELFCEGSFDAVDENMAGLMGAVFPLGDELRMALTLRHYPETYDSSYSGPVRSSTYACDESGASVGLEFAGWTFTTDYSRLSAWTEENIKVLLSKNLKLSRCLSAKLRLTQRTRNYGLKNRSDLRVELGWDKEPWLTNIRLNALACSQWGFLAYAEQGYKCDAQGLWLRMTLFHIDNWDDRIYVYERDAPGNYNVPAYYRRGYSLSLNASCTFRFGGNRLRAYLRLATTQYPWLSPGMSEKKEENWEARFQVMLDL